MSEMKLIMENWKGFLNEQPTPNTQQPAAPAAAPAQPATAPAKPAAAPAQAESPEKINTFGDLKRHVQSIIDLKRQVEMGKIAKDAGADAIKAKMNLVTLGWTGMATTLLKTVIAAKDVGKLAMAAKLPDEQTEKNPYLDAFNIDDEYSKILDDRIENSFINHLSKQLKNIPDNTPIMQFDVNKVLEDFLKQKFANRGLAGGTGKKAGQVEKGAAKQTAKQRAGQLAIGAAKATAVAE